jgi:hypothetical protein
VDQLNHVFAREVSTFADVKHAVTLSGVAILPFGRNRLLLSNANRFVDEIVNGWEVTPIYTYYSGFAWRPRTPVEATRRSMTMRETGRWLPARLSISQWELATPSCLQMVLTVTAEFVA